MMSTVTPTVRNAPAAARAGADLREARERLGLSLHDVAFTLRIRLPHLESLEQGRLSTLPGNAYALAFVRTYANALGLDAQEMVRRFKTESAEVGCRPDLVFLTPMPERGMPAGAVVLLGVVLAVGAYTGWYRLSGEGRLPAEAVTAIPERLAPLAQQALPVATSSIAEATAAAKIIPPSATIALATPAPPAMAISPGSAAAAQLPAHDFPVASGLSPVTAPALDRMVVRATADAWLLVKDRGGVVLLNRVLKAGETWPVPARPDLLLTTGNAGGTEIVVDGASIPSIGGPGTVRRDLPLDLDGIRDGKLASTQMAPARAVQ